MGDDVSTGMTFLLLYVTAIRQGVVSGDERSVRRGYSEGS